jgi:hypothetical protein
MANIRWAYVDCAGSGTGGGQAAGPTGSIQFLSSSNATSGSTQLRFITSSNTLLLTGSLQVVGTITASSFFVNQTDVVSGSTIFGNSTSDTHKLTGSFFVSAVGAPPIFNVDIAKSQSINLGARFNYRSITTSRLTSSTSDYILGVGSTGSIELRLATAASHGAGAVLLVKDETASRAGSITLSSSSPNTIDGAGFYEITGTMPAISLYSNGSHWFVF